MSAIIILNVVLALLVVVAVVSLLGRSIVADKVGLARRPRRQVEAASARTGRPAPRQSYAPRADPL